MALGIVAVLAALSVPVFSRVTQGSRAAACMSNLRQLGAALAALRQRSQHGHAHPGRRAGDKNGNHGGHRQHAQRLRHQPEGVSPARRTRRATPPPAGRVIIGTAFSTVSPVTNLHLLNLSTTNSLIPVLCDKDTVPSLRAEQGEHALRGRPHDERTHVRRQKIATCSGSITCRNPFAANPRWNR